MKKETLLKILYACLAVIIIVFTMSYIYYSIESKINNVYAEEYSIPSGNGALYTDNKIIENNGNKIYFGTAINPNEDLSEEGWSSLSYTITSNFRYSPIRNYFQQSTWKDATKTDIDNNNYKKIKINNIDYYNFNFSLNLNYNSTQVINSNSTYIGGYPYQYLYIYFVDDNTNIIEIGLYSNTSKTQYVLTYYDYINREFNSYLLRQPYDSTESYVYFNVSMPSNSFTRFTYRDISYVLNMSSSALTIEQMQNLYLAFNSQNYQYIYGSTPQNAFYSGYNQGVENTNNYWQNYYKNQYESEIEQAYENGKLWGLNHNTNSAWGSSWDFIGSAFSGVGNILSIELLPNIPLWTFIAIPLLFGLIAVLYKLIGG